MNEKSIYRKKLPRVAVFICFVAVLFAAISTYYANRMRKAAQNMYEHPYAVTNTAGDMRSNLMDMERFIDIFLTTGFESEENTRKLFGESYKMQNDAIETLYERYLGPLENVDDLRVSLDKLIEAQEKALKYVNKHTDEEILIYIQNNVYPYYDEVVSYLDKIIAFADAEIYGLAESSMRMSLLSSGTAFILTALIIFLTLYSNNIERRNITELVERERELNDALLLAQKANSAKKDFLSRMSHEIRTPMNVIIGMTAIAGTHMQDHKRMEGCLAKIAFSSRHLLSIINDVLDMSKIEEGKLSVNNEPFSLHQLTESVIAVVYSQTKGQGKNFECYVDGVDQEIFLGDFMRVNQILLNLLSNAIKFTPQGGSIKLGIKQVSGKNDNINLQFIVSDTGIGMSGDFLLRLFEPFEQADSKISQKYGGTGLGMAITHNLVELLGGSIQVESKLGEGTTFTVELPFDLPTEPIDHKVWQLGDLKVLVVDNDEYACKHANLLLKRMGIDAQWVKYGREAVNIVLEAHSKGSNYDVCIVDWRMPDMDGIEVTRSIREKLGPDTLIIIISAYDWSEIEAEARNAGANAFISKPLFESTIYNVLMSSLGPEASAEKKMEVQPQFCYGKRFLLVEDNELNREIASELLSATGAEIDCAGDGKEAFERFVSSSEGYYDLVLMDVQMPIMDGYTSTKKIRASGHPSAKTVPIVAMTANTFSEDIDAAYSAGMNCHIAKPVEIKTLYQTIAELLDSREGLDSEADQTIDD